MKLNCFPSRPIPHRRKSGNSVFTHGPCGQSSSAIKVSPTAEEDPHLPTVWQAPRADTQKQIPQATSLYPPWTGLNVNRFLLTLTVKVYIVTVTV